MKYVVDLEALKNCIDLLPTPVKANGEILVNRIDVKALIDAFPKDELKETKSENKPVYRGE